jgi:5-formyltetrahydrofolate cyclo-ligase
MTRGEEIAAQKALFRSKALRELRAITAEDRAARSETICRKIAESQPWRNAQRVLLFSPMRTEPDISPLARAAEAVAKSVTAIPSTIRVETELDLPFIPDLVLVPGLAFSRAGHRLGRGGGFYDRLLAGRARDAFKLGICFSLQLLECVPIEDHDTVLDGVISD